MVLGLLLLVVLTAGCQAPDVAAPTLREARSGHVAGVVVRSADQTPPRVPPPELFRLVRYPARLGDFAAYLTVPPGDGVRRPAIIWIPGSEYGAIRDVWSPRPPEEDMSGRAFREAGIVTMYPSLRGRNGNPGFREGFYGEVDDVLAAADYLARQAFVDPKRIYLAGHSTGGTLVLLTAEIDGRFRAVFSLAPAADVRSYPASQLPPIAPEDWRGFELRSPLYWLSSIRSPVFVFEGDGPNSNIDDLRRLSYARRNPLTHFYLVRGKNHVTAVPAVTALIARKIIADTGPKTNIAFPEPELDEL